jgi:molybdopterin converting factor small subunit
MAVAVLLPAVLRPYARGAERVEVPGATTVGAVLAGLEQDHPALRRRLLDDQGGLRRHVNVFLGEDNVRDLSEMSTPVSDGDELLVLPAVSGG